MLENIFSRSLSKREQNRRFKEKMLGGESDLVMTWAIGTPDNPMAQKADIDTNRKNRKRFEEVLHDSGYEFTRVKGNYGVSENSYFIMNLTVDDAKWLFGMFNQESFIYGKKDKVGDEYKLTMEFYSHSSPDDPYELADTETQVVDVDSKKDTMFTVTHGGWKFNIPWSIFQSLGRQVRAKYSNVPYDVLFNSYRNYIDICSEIQGSARWYRRKRMIHSFTTM